MPIEVCDFAEMSASSTKTQIHELELYEWKDFLENSRKFMLQIIASNKQTYKRVNFDSSFTVHSHDDINTEIMFICRNIFKALHLYKMYFAKKYFLCYFIIG